MVHMPQSKMSAPHFMESYRRVGSGWHTSMMEASSVFPEEGDEILQSTARAITLLNIADKFTCSMH